MMNIIIPNTYDRDFIDKLVAKIIDDIKLKLITTNFELLTMWIQVEYGFDESVTCKKILEFALNHFEIVSTTSNYIIQFNPITYYTGTTIRLITLLKTITYGTRHFKGNTILIDEFKRVNTNLDNLYQQYRFLGVVI